MRKILTIVLAMSLFLFIACNKSNDTTENVVNALILEINQENKTLLVEGTDPNSILGNNCYVDCSEAKIYKIEEEKTIDLDFSDLEVGDNILADVREVAESYPTQTSTNKIQLVEK